MDKIQVLIEIDRISTSDLQNLSGTQLAHFVLLHVSDLQPNGPRHHPVWDSIPPGTSSPLGEIPLAGHRPPAPRVRGGVRVHPRKKAGLHFSSNEQSCSLERRVGQHLIIRLHDLSKDQLRQFCLLEFA
jgi:hypothetical protein